MPDTRAAQTSATGNTLKKLAAAEPTRRYCECHGLAGIHGR
jgi:hypothetical protein